jgi:hypothetical protein
MEAATMHYIPVFFLFLEVLVMVPLTVSAAGKCISTPFTAEVGGYFRSTDW